MEAVRGRTYEKHKRPNENVDVKGAYSHTSANSLRKLHIGTQATGAGKYAHVLYNVRELFTLFLFGTRFARAQKIGKRKKLFSKSSVNNIIKVNKLDGVFSPVV